MFGCKAQYDPRLLAEFVGQQKLILDLLGKINKQLTLHNNMTLADAFTSLAASDAELTKDLGEISTTVTTLQKNVADLTAQLANVTLTPDQQASVDNIAATAKKLDDITPDAPAAPAEPAA